MKKEIRQIVSRENGELNLVRKEGYIFNYKGFGIHFYNNTENSTCRNNRWIATETRSGHRIGNGATRKEAVECVKSIIDEKSKEALEKTIGKGIKIKEKIQKRLIKKAFSIMPSILDKLTKEELK